jgi:hypothetical protein
MKTVIASQNENLLWYSEHLSVFTPNLFAATVYDDATDPNGAVETVIKLKAAGHNAATELLTIAAERYHRLTQQQETDT